MTQEDIVTINEDLSIIKLRKKALFVGLRTYQVSDKDEVCSSGKNYSLSGKTKDKGKFHGDPNEISFTVCFIPRILHTKEHSFVFTTRELPSLKRSPHARPFRTAKPYICRHRK